VVSQAHAAEYSFLVGFEGDWRDTWWNADFLALMARRWRLFEARRVLDVGCGVGHWGRTLLPFMHPDATIDGVDREPSFIEKAGARAAALGLAQRATYRPAAVEALPFDDGSFDVVTCQTVLIHVADVAVALREICRVLRPGGLVAVVEPNNLAEAMTFLRGSPAPSWSDFLQLLDFQHTCESGKRALGHGDSSVGDLLPGLFARAGLEAIAVHQSDKCPALIPPYRTPDQAIDLRQLLTWIDAGLWMHGGGTRQDTERLYLAGSGDPSRFEALWQLALANEQRFKAAVLAGTYDGGRAVTTYLVSGRKPV
jgi:SAM-dependent methyltransferase